ncbi:MAG: hypothetical protein ACI9ES_001525 [Oceanospirillaceae bacterium]
MVKREFESPLSDQKKPLIEILTGLQNSLTLLNYKALDLMA